MCILIPCICIARHLCELDLRPKVCFFGPEEAPCVFVFSQHFMCRSRVPCVIWSTRARLDETP